MLTKSLSYPIAAVTSTSFWRWTEKLEWMRWSLAWEKRGLALPLLPKQHARHSWEDAGGSEQNCPHSSWQLPRPRAL